MGRNGETDIESNFKFQILNFKKNLNILNPNIKYSVFIVVIVDYRFRY